MKIKKKNNKKLEYYCKSRIIIIIIIIEGGGRNYCIFKSLESFCVQVLVVEMNVKIHKKLQRFNVFQLSNGNAMDRIWHELLSYSREGKKLKKKYGTLSKRKYTKIRTTLLP